MFKTVCSQVGHIRSFGKKTANCVFVSIYSNLHFTCSIFDSILNWLIHLFSYFIKQHRIAVVSLHCLLWYGHQGHAIFTLVWRMPLHPGVRDVISFLLECNETGDIYINSFVHSPATVSTISCHLYNSCQVFKCTQNSSINETGQKFSR